MQSFPHYIVRFPLSYFSDFSCYRYHKNYKKLPGSPDIVLTKYKIAIFCDSEFFHGKDWEILKLRLEKGKNPDYWIKKIERNRTRD